jgi:hypothetical protein
MIGQLISVKSIIEDFYGDTDTQEPVNYENFIRWTVDALNKIGHPLQYRRKVTGKIDNPNLDIENYRAKLPCNVHKIEQIMVNGLPARYSTDSFHHLLGGDCCFEQNSLPYGSTSSYSEGFYIDGFGNEFYAGFPAPTTNCDITYDVNADCLTLSVKEGEVCIAYLEFPFDEEGFPLVPDNESYREALVRYFTLKIDYINWRKNPNSQGARMLYEDSKQEWAFYVGQASNSAKLHSVDQLESIKNQLLRTFQSYNHHRTGFKNLGLQQQRRIK